jgi:putative copper export protein/methionine-rich copper-binding protein CopC/mono/diheme cytochrome c family protein
MRFIKYLLPLTAVIVVIFFFTLQTAAAHAVPISSSPLPNHILDEGPADLSIYFNEPVVPEFSRIRLLTQAGQPLDVGPTQPLGDDNRSLGISLPPLSEGAYLVSWQALSAVDGHTTSGTFSFGVGDVALAIIEADPVIGDIPRLSPTAHLLMLVGLALLIHFFSSRLSLRNPLFTRMAARLEKAGFNQATIQIGLRLTYLALGLLIAALILTVYDQVIAYHLWRVIGLANISPLSATARWLTLTGLALLIGFFSFRLLVWRPLFSGVEIEPDEAALDQATAQTGLRFVYLGLGLLLLALGLTLFDQAVNFRLWEGGNWRPWLATQFGQMWLLRLLLLLPFGGLVATLAPRPTARRGWFWGVGLALSVTLAGTSSLISHSAALSSNTWQAIGVDLTHTIAAGVWAGGLLFLGLALFQARHLEPELKTWLNLSLILNFSAVAALSIGLLIFSGAYLAGQHVGNWTALVGTAYGLVLLGKLAIALLAFILAGVNLLVIKPRLNAAYDAPESPQAARTRRRFRTVVMVEMGLAFVILAAAGLLSDLQRGADAPLLADAPGQMTTSTPADDLTVTLTVEPALVGQNQFEVYVTDDQGNPVTEAESVLFRFTFLGQSLGSEEATAESLGSGRYVLEGSYISLIGSWQVEVSVRRPGQFDAFAPYRLEAGLGGEIRPLAQRPRLMESVAHWMTLAAGGGTGLLLMLVALIWAAASARAAQTSWQLAAMLLLAILAFGMGANQMVNFVTNEYTPATFLNNPILPDVESVAVGQFYYQQHCAACHGEEGRGDGPAGLALSPRPADFGDGHLTIHPDGDLYYWIRNGIEGTAMPGFGQQLSSEDTWHLVNYLRRLSVEAQAAYSSETEP